MLQTLMNNGMNNGVFWLLVRGILVYTAISPFVAGNTSKIVSAVVASTIGFFVMRYVVFSRKRWFKGRL